MEHTPCYRPQPFLIMGIVNITPDSFSDGGAFLTSEKAIAHGLELAAQGADIIDLGAESTRPGASELKHEEEWARLKPVLAGLSQKLPAGKQLSLDSRKPELMRRALDYGVAYINNVAGLADRQTLDYLATRGVSYIAMHMQGEPANMQRHPLCGAQAPLAVAAFFQRAFHSLQARGFPANRIWLDPGIGFGKDDQANLLLMGHTAYYAQAYNIAIGISRKAWLGRTLGLAEPKARDHPSKIAELALAMAGARMIRTHAVAPLAGLRQVLLKAE